MVSSDTQFGAGQGPESERQDPFVTLTPKLDRDLLLAIPSGVPLHIPDLGDKRDGFVRNLAVFAKEVPVEHYPFLVKALSEPESNLSRLLICPQLSQALSDIVPEICVGNTRAVGWRDNETGVAYLDCAILPYLNEIAVTESRLISAWADTFINGLPELRHYLPRVFQLVSSLMIDSGKPYLGSVDSKLGFGIISPINPKEEGEIFDPIMATKPWRGQTRGSKALEGINKLINSEKLPDLNLSVENLKVIRAWLETELGYIESVGVAISFADNQLVRLDSQNYRIFDHRISDAFIHHSLIALPTEALKALLTFTSEHMRKGQQSIGATAEARNAYAYSEMIWDLALQPEQVRADLALAFSQLGRSGWKTELHLELVDTASKLRESILAQRYSENAQNWSGQRKANLIRKHIARDGTTLTCQLSNANPDDPILLTHHCPPARLAELSAITEARPDQIATLLRANRSLTMALGGNEQLGAGYIDRMLLSFKPDLAELPANALLEDEAFRSGMVGELNNAIISNRMASALGMVSFLRLILPQHEIKDALAQLTLAERIDLLCSFKGADYDSELFARSTDRIFTKFFALTPKRVDRDTSSFKSNQISGLGVWQDAESFLLSPESRAGNISSFFSQLDLDENKSVSLKVIAAHRRLLGNVVRRWGVALGLAINEGLPIPDFLKGYLEELAESLSSVGDISSYNISGRRVVLAATSLRDWLTFGDIPRAELNHGAQVVCRSIDKLLAHRPEALPESLSIEGQALKRISLNKDPVLLARIYEAMAESLGRTPKRYPAAQNWIAALSGVLVSKENTLKVVKYLFDREPVDRKRDRAITRLLDSCSAAERHSILESLFVNKSAFDAYINDATPTLREYLLDTLPRELYRQHLRSSGTDEVRTLVRGIDPSRVSEVLSESDSIVRESDVVTRELYESLIDEIPMHLEDHYSGEMVPNHFRNLGVPRTATVDQMKISYRKLAMAYHSDRFMAESPEQQLRAKQIIAKIMEAYEVLSNDEKRGQYMKGLELRASFFPAVAWYQLERQAVKLETFTLEQYQKLTDQFPAEFVLKDRRIPNHYAALLLPMAANSLEISERFRSLAQMLHPDKSGKNTEQLFQRVESAYRVLSDPALRRQYDLMRPQTRSFYPTDR